MPTRYQTKTETSGAACSSITNTCSPFAKTRSCTAPGFVFVFVTLGAVFSAAEAGHVLISIMAATPTATNAVQNPCLRLPLILASSSLEWTS